MEIEGGRESESKIEEMKEKEEMKVRECETEMNR